MNRVESWVLTDDAADVGLKTFEVRHDNFAESFPAPWSVRKRSLRGGRRTGVDVVEVDNGALSFTVLPTRGMGIWQGAYRGNRLGWRAPVQGPVHPHHVDLLDRGGLGWLDGFDEWICRCGLSSNGPPVTDPKTNEFLTLHGRIANLPAHYLEVQVGLDPPYELKVIGQVDEATLFFGRLRLTSTLTTTPDSNLLVIEDIVENLSTKPAELELLYHCNFGPPFVEAGSKVIAPVRMLAPRDAAAARGINHIDTCQGPTPGFAEQVYYTDLLANREGWTLVLLHSARSERGVAVRMARTELPHFILWKNTAAAEDGYVVGLEPATNFPNRKPFERERGRVIMLPSKQQYRTTVIIEVHDDAAGVRGLLNEIIAIQGSTRPLVHPAPQPEYS